jgi:hypothetical protein
MNVMMEMLGRTFERRAELVVRFNFIFSAVIGFLTALMLTACASPTRVVWSTTINALGETAGNPMSAFDPKRTFAFGTQVDLDFHLDKMISGLRYGMKPSTFW